MMSENQIVKKTADYIELHLAEDLSLNKIARELNYSKFYIARTFAEETGTTVHKYIQGRRLSTAARQLVESDRPITDIAYEAGYSTPQAFSQAFRRLYLCPPQSYRKKGVFYPKQKRLFMGGRGTVLSAFNFRQGGRMAA